MMTNANNTTTLRIRHEATLTSNGTHHHGCCKPIIAVDIPKTFNSLTDAAEYFGVSIQQISDVLNGRHKTIGLYERDENGNKIRLICRTRFTLAAHAETVMDTVMENSRKAKEELDKANARIAELEAKAAKWDAYEAHQKTITNAKEKIERRKAIERRKQEEYQLAIARRQEAENELAELTKGDVNVA